MFDAITYNDCLCLTKYCKTSRPKIDAEIVYGLLNGKIDPENHPIGRNRIIECYNRPAQYDVILHVVNVVLDGCGVEALTLDNGKGYIDFVNFGDPYIPTVCHYDGKFIICGWGDIVEYLDMQEVSDV